MSRIAFVVLALSLTAALSRPASAHSVPLGGTWSPDGWTVAALLLFWWLYGRGLGALWGKAGIGRAIPLWRAACYALGMATLAAALASPVDAWGAWSFSWHMVQHVLLSSVAAPLLMLGNPAAAFGAALRGGGSGLARGWRRIGGRRLERIGPAAVLQMGLLWAWHAPAAFEAGLENEAVHTAQHLSFVLPSMLFWHAVLTAGRRGIGGMGVAALWVLATITTTGLLSALITLATTPLYPSYGGDMGDQQLAGLIMWVPGGLPHLVAGLWLVWALLRRDQEADTASAGRPRTSAT